MIELIKEEMKERRIDNADDDGDYFIGSHLFPSSLSSPPRKAHSSNDIYLFLGGNFTPE